MAKVSESGDLVKTKFSDKSIENGTLTIVLGNGKSFSISKDEVDASIHDDVFMHGLSQKIGDSYASAKGDYAFAEENIQRVIDQMKNGEWRAARASGGGESKPRITELAEAIAQLKGVPVDAAVAALATKSEDEKKAIRNNAKIKLIIQQIRTAKAAKAAEKAEDFDL